MSETAERETEVVAGAIEGVTQKRPDTWQVAVKPEGSQYAKNLWTKDAALVASLTEKLGQHGAFVCNASYWTNNSGTQVRSLWIDAPAENGAQSTGTRPQPASAPKDEGGMTKEEWRHKDDAAHKRACIAIASAALQHTVPSDPSNEDLARFLERVALLSGAWHRIVLAVRDDPAGEDIPFG